MTAASTGQEVEVHLRGRLTDGTEFLSTYPQTPLQFRLGDGSVIGGLESAIRGMTAGQRKKVRLSPDRAFGFRNEGLVLRVPRSRLENQVEIGDEVMLPFEEERSFRIIELGSTDALLDGNHPLAGKAVDFEIELVSLTFMR